MKKALTILLTIVISYVSADEITQKQAIKTANNFYIERNSINPGTGFSEDYCKNVFTKKIFNTPVYYYVNYHEGGWAIISATNVVRPILAYSYNGNINPDLEPDNFRAWIGQYSSQIYDAVNQNIDQTDEVKEQWNYYLQEKPDAFRSYVRQRSVEPLLVSSWDQGLYYNEMCPPDPMGPGGHCLTGCVPTCMGQIANYFRWPETGEGEYSYDGGDYGTLSANFGETTYNWNEMSASVTNNDLATAQILYHFGVSCDLVYGPDGSGMYNHKAAYAFKTHFKYSPDTEYLYRDSTDLNWDSVIVAHLDRKIPLYYAGWSVPNINGHAFVCDGYEDTDYFHFNWGWSGSYDGYFYTGNLNPGGSNFNLAQELIINCFPDTANYTYPILNTGTDTVTAISGTLDDGSGPIYNYSDNQDCAWLIAPSDSIQYITLDFYRFDLNNNDTLFVYDGESSESTLLSALTGTEIPDPIISTGTKLFLEFVTDDSVSASGWLVGYESVLPVFCSGNVMLSESSGNISDGSGDANYQNLTTCIWIISPGTTDDIVLKFSEFSTEADHDFLTIYDGSTEIGSYSGHDLPPELTASQGTITLVFSTNSSITDLGWDANYYTSSVGYTENSMEEISFYPNPTNDILNIQNISNLNRLRIYTISGNILSDIDISGKQEITVFTKELPQGMYLMEASGKGKSITRKFFVKH